MQKVKYGETEEVWIIEVKRGLPSSSRAKKGEDALFHKAF